MAEKHEGVMTGLGSGLRHVLATDTDHVRDVFSGIEVCRWG